MKKTFPLTMDNKKPERVVEAIKKETKKYIARERRKELPENVPFWDFDCKVGENEESAKVIHLNDLNKNISQIATTGAKSLYIEILVKRGEHARTKTEDSSQGK